MLKHNRPLVLVVAGLDSSGGAGISADCITVHDNAAFALPCVTALTSQSLSKISMVVPTDEALFEDTLKLAFEDSKAISAIKVGLISDDRLLKILLKYLENEFKGIPVVWDPVLTGTAGDLHSVDLKAYLKDILKYTTIFTPNLNEALELASWSKEDFKQKGVKALAQVFLDLGCQNVVIKGGHNIENTDAKDYFASKEVSFFLVCPKVEGLGAHGGGCALSSSLAAFLANDFAPHDAMVLAKAYVTGGIKEPAHEVLEQNDLRPPIGHHGLPTWLDDFPQVFEEGFPSYSERFAPCPLHLGLYPVVDSVEWIERLVNQGVKTIQLRIKDKSDPKLFDKIKAVVDFCEPKAVRLFIDDHYELAIKAHAYGVHLGMEDLKTADLKSIQKAGLRLGVSTHGAYEMLKAMQLQPSYIALGHIFPTQSKKMPSKPQGVFKLALEQEIIQDLVPTVAIGGIKLHNVEDVLETGVGSVALITGITKADDPDKETQVWLKYCTSGD